MVPCLATFPPFAWKLDVIYEREYPGAITQEKYCVRRGRFCGLILLNSIQNGEPLALINDGDLQHIRVGADSGIGMKYISREDAEVVGMIWPGRHGALSRGVVFVGAGD